MIQFLIQLQGEKSARNLFCSIVAAKKPLILHNGILDLVSIVIKLLDVDVVERNSKASSPMKGSELEKKAELANECVNKRHSEPFPAYDYVPRCSCTVTCTPRFRLRCRRSWPIWRKCFRLEFTTRRRLPSTNSVSTQAI